MIDLRKLISAVVLKYCIIHLSVTNEFVIVFEYVNTSLIGFSSKQINAVSQYILLSNPNPAMHVGHV